MTTRIAFLIPRLTSGGAERQLVELIDGIDRSRFEVEVWTFYDGGIFWDYLKQKNIPLVCLQKKSRYEIISVLLRLVKNLRQRKPQILYSFLENANVFALAASIFSKVKVIWSVRNSDREKFLNGLGERLAQFAEARLSFMPAAIVSNSRAGIRHRTSHGFPQKKLHYVPNAINFERFKNDSEARKDFRKLHSLDDKTLAIGGIGTITFVKDVLTFIRAAHQMKKECEENQTRQKQSVHVRFFWIGKAGTPNYFEEAKKLVSYLSLEKDFVWVGEVRDPLAIYSWLDICTVSSVSEGFPNVIGESIASGVRCVSSDVGDTRELLKDERLIFKPGDVAGLVASWNYALQEYGPSRLEELARSLAAEFNVQRTIRESEQIFLASLTG